MATHKHDIDMPELRVALARRDWRWWHLASSLNVHPSTLSAWLHQRKRGPRDLRERIERVFEMPAGELKRKAAPLRAVGDEDA